MRLLIAAVFLCPTTAAAAPTFFNGNMVYELCQSTPRLAALYATGVMDGGTTVTEWRAESPRFCGIDHITVEQVKDVMCSYLGRYPEKRHLASSALALNAFQEAWPCPR